MLVTPRGRLDSLKEPSLKIRLENLKRCQSFSGHLAMPGDINPMSRFVRAASYLKTLPLPEPNPEAVASLFSVAGNVAVPYDANDPSINSRTQDHWPPLWTSRRWT